MITEELFEKVISERGWYHRIGISRQAANTYKARFLKGTLKEEGMTSLLIRLGYTYTQSEKNWDAKINSTP